MSEDGDLLDDACAGDSDCAWSEGGDSLLDNEEDVECDSECLQSPLPHAPPSSPPPNVATSPLSNGQYPSANEKWCESTGLSSPSHQEIAPDVTYSERARVIRLDGQRKFRCVSDTLPEVPPPKRTFSHRNTVPRKPRRLTKPSLLLEPKRLLVQEPHSDLRNTLIANRMSRLKNRDTSGVREEDDWQSSTGGTVEHSLDTDHLSPHHSLWSTAASPSPNSLFLQSTASPPQERPTAVWSAPTTTESATKSLFPKTGSPASVNGRLPLFDRSLPHPPPTSQTPPTAGAEVGKKSPHSAMPDPETVNPFYAKMQELPRLKPSSPDGTFNPFLTALQRVEAQQATISDYTEDHTHSFSFSLSHITS